MKTVEAMIVRYMNLKYSVFSKHLPTRIKVRNVDVFESTMGLSMQLMMGVEGTSRLTTEGRIPSSVHRPRCQM